MSRFFISRPIFSSVISIVIVIAGIMAARVLPVAQYPEITPPTVVISASYPGASAETLARTVAGPIDLDNPGVAPSAFEQEVSVQPSEDDHAGKKDAQERQHGELGGDDHPVTDTNNQGDRGNYESGSLQSSDLIQDVPPAEELTDDLASFLEEPETQVEADQQSEQPREEPETDERRMIAAE